MTTSYAALTHGPVHKHLVSLTLPMTWGVLAMMAFNFADTWFVAQLGERELAAMSFCFPVVMVLISVGIGLMAGTSSVLARVIGENNPERVRRLTMDALLLASVLSMICSVLGILSMEPLFRLLGATDDVLPLIKEYMTIWYWGIFFFLVPMVGMGALRATGDSKLTSQIMIGSSLVNLILDPLLIFGWGPFPRLELAGAAWATVIARGLTIIIGFWALHVSKKMLALSFVSMSQMWSSWKQVMHVGLPAVGTNVIIPASTGVIIAMLAQHGENVVAAFGAATRIEQVTLVVYYAMSGIIGPFVGQNLGASKFSRITTAMRQSTIFCLVSGLIFAAVLAPFSTLLMQQFSHHTEVITIGVLYLLWIPISYGAQGVVMVVNAAFNGLGKPMPAVMISVLRMVVLYIPLAWVGNRWFGVVGIFAAITLANLIVAVIAHIWFKKLSGNKLILVHRTGANQG